MAKNRPNKKNKNSKIEKTKVKKQKKKSSKTAQKEGSLKDSSNKPELKSQKKGEQQAKNEISQVDIKKFKTLEQYKLYISKLCTSAVTYPETEAKNVKLLFNVVEKKGGGPEPLLEHAKKLATLSLVSVVCHLLPRMSYELNEVDQEVVKRTESSHSAKIIDQEREITKRTRELRDQLLKYIASNLPENPGFFLPLVSRLISSDNRVCDELFGLGLKYSKVSESVLSSLKELFKYGSLVDIHRYLKFIFKSPHINHKVIRIINEIQINKKQHEFLVSESSLKTEERKSKNKDEKDTKFKNEIMTWIVTFYSKTLREGKNAKMMEACMEGAGKFGLILEEGIQMELLGELRRVLKEFVEKEGMNFSLVMSGLNASLKLVKVVQNFEYNWIYEVFTKLCLNMTPVLFQGELKLTDDSKLELEGLSTKIQEERSVFLTNPCHTYKFLRCLDNLTNLLVKSTVVADFQVLTEMVQALISMSTVVDSNVALSLLHYVNDIVAKIPKLKSLLSREGIVFSILTRGKSSYWDLRLLNCHYSNHIKSMFKGSTNEEEVQLKNKVNVLPVDPREVDMKSYFNYSGLEVYQILFSGKFIENLGI